MVGRGVEGLWREKGEGRTGWTVFFWVRAVSRRQRATRPHHQAPRPPPAHNARTPGPAIWGRREAPTAADWAPTPRARIAVRGRRLAACREPGHSGDPTQTLACLSASDGTGSGQPGGRAGGTARRRGERGSSRQWDLVPPRPTTWPLTLAPAAAAGESVSEVPTGAGHWGARRRRWGGGVGKRPGRSNCQKPNRSSPSASGGGAWWRPSVRTSTEAVCGGVVGSGAEHKRTERKRDEV